MVLRLGIKLEVSKKEVVESCEQLTHEEEEELDDEEESDPTPVCQQQQQQQHEEAAGACFVTLSLCRPSHEHRERSKAIAFDPSTCPCPSCKQKW